MMSVFRERLGMSSISGRSQRIILSGWRQGTKKQYNTYYKKCLDLKSRKDINPIDTTIARVLDFLSELVESDLSYSAINTARAALSPCVTVENGMALSEHILVKKFMKGVYELRPALSKYNQILDPETVLQFLMKSSPLSMLSLKQLTLKLVMLTALVTGQRCQSIFDGPFIYRSSSSRSSCSQNQRRLYKRFIVYSSSYCMVLFYSYIFDY